MKDEEFAERLYNATKKISEEKPNLTDEEFEKIVKTEIKKNIAYQEAKEIIDSNIIKEKLAIFTTGFSIPTLFFSIAILIKKMIT